MEKPIRKKRIVLIVCFFVMAWVLGLRVDAAEPKLSSKQLNMYVGMNKKLTVKNVGEAKPIWKSSNTSIVAVKKLSDDTVKLMAKRKKGTAVVSVKVSGKKLKCRVTVKDWELSASNGLTIDVGSKTTLQCKGVKAKGFSSSNPQIASVNKKGKVTGKKTGECRIIYTVGRYRYKTTVKVKKAKLNYSKLTIKNGEGKILSMNIDGKVKFSVKNSKVVSLTKRNDYSVIVRAVNPGSTTVTATINNKHYKCTITVPNTGPVMSLGDFIFKDGGSYSKVYTSVEAGKTGTLNIKNSASGVIHYLFLFADTKRVSSDITVSSSNNNVFKYIGLSGDSLEFHSFQDGTATVTIKYKGFTYKYKVTIQDSYSKTCEQEKNKIYQAAGINQNMSRQQKCYRLASWICDNAVYDPEVLASMADASPGVNATYKDYFRHKKIVCAGYTDLFLYLCHDLQIPCRNVLWASETHTWNQVEIDGKWYNIDITWMDAEKDGLYCFEYFLVSDQCMQEFSQGKHTNAKKYPCSDTRFDGCVRDQLKLQNQELGKDYAILYINYCHLSPWKTGTWVNY